MRIQIRIHGIAGAAALRRQAQERLQAALAGVAPLVREALVTLDGARDRIGRGAGHWCRVVLRLRDDSILVVEDRGGAPGPLLERLGTNLGRRILARFARPLARLAAATRPALPAIPASELP